MLSSIYVESLFEVYTYTLDLKPAEASFRFITGPNGYGKTTILNMLDALYTGNITALAGVPFKTFRLTFDDHYEVAVEQRRDYAIEDAILLFSRPEYPDFCRHSLARFKIKPMLCLRISYSCCGGMHVLMRS